MNSLSEISLSGRLCENDRAGLAAAELPLPVAATRLFVRHNVAGGKVEISTAAMGGRAVHAVANTRPAIPPDAVGRLFQPFMRLDGRRVHHDSGHGLGLCIVRAIAAAHDAAITVRARHGGLSIEVTFPAMPDEPLLAGPAGVARRGDEGGSAWVRSAR